MLWSIKSIRTWLLEQQFTSAHIQVFTGAPRLYHTHATHHSVDLHVSWYSIDPNTQLLFQHKCVATDKLIGKCLGVSMVTGK